MATVDIEITGEPTDDGPPQSVEDVLRRIEVAFSAHRPAPRVSSHVWHTGRGRQAGYRVAVEMPDD